MSFLVIANKALRKLGVPEIESLEQDGKPAAACNAAIKDVYREVLIAHSWAFATKWEKLARMADEPPFGYRYAFQLPPEAERLIDIRPSKLLIDERIKYEMAMGGVIYTDAEFCYARYIVYTEDMKYAPSDFKNAVACKLAAEVSKKLSRAEFHNEMLQEYALILDSARTNDEAMSNSKKTDENLECKFLSVREFESESTDKGLSWILNS